MLTNPKHPIVIGIIEAYSSETSLHIELNKALRDMIEEYQYLIGPFAHILYKIVKSGSIDRDDIQHFGKKNPVKLFRGTKLSKNQIGEHKKIKESEKALLHFYGFISTSTERDVAENFMN